MMTVIVSSVTLATNQYILYDIVNACNSTLSKVTDMQYSVVMSVVIVSSVTPATNQKILHWIVHALMAPHSVALPYSF